MIFDNFINIVHQYVSGDILTPFGRFIYGLWMVYSQVNGNPETNNYGIRLFLMLFFALFLIVILQLKTRLIYDKKHFVVYIGSLFLVFRCLTMLGFEWGWQIGMYDDWILHLLSPPLEHFWNLLFFGCLAYYTLNIYNYYPGILEKIIKYIPIGIISFFVYSTIQWKMFFIDHLPQIPKYNMCMADWQNHLITSCISLYVVIIGITKYKKFHNYILAFWVITLIEHSIRTITFYNRYEPAELATFFHSLATWSLPILILHFTTVYITRNSIPTERRVRTIRDNNEIFIKCDDCPKPIVEQTS